MAGWQRRRRGNRTVRWQRSWPRRGIVYHALLDRRPDGRYAVTVGVAAPGDHLLDMRGGASPGPLSEAKATAEQLVAEVIAIDRKATG